MQRRDTVAFCQANEIVVEAYSPLTRGQRLGHSVVKAIASETSRSAAQVLLRWGLQKGVVVLPGLDADLDEGAWRAVDTIANYPDLLGILEACRVTLS